MKSYISEDKLGKNTNKEKIYQKIAQLIKLLKLTHQFKSTIIV